MLFSSDKNNLKAYGTIFSGDGMAFIDHFEALEKKHAEITLHLHTYGGSLFDGNLIYNAINQSASKVHLKVDGLAASMGGIILMAADKVSIVENGYILFHAPSGAVQGSAADHENYANLLRSMEDNFITKLMQRTGKSREDAAKWMVGDHWLDAKSAQSLGLVQAVIPAQVKAPAPSPSPEQIGEREMYNLYASLLLPSPDLQEPVSKLKKEQKEQKIINMKTLLITAFTLSAVTAESSDTAVLEALKEKFKELESDLEKAVAEKNTLSQKIKETQKHEIEALIKAHEKNHPIKDKKKEVLKKNGETSGVEALREVLETQPQAPNVSGQIQKGKAGARADWDWDKWQKEDPRGLEKMSLKDPETYQKLFKQKYN